MRRLCCMRTALRRARNDRQGAAQSQHRQRRLPASCEPGDRASRAATPFRGRVHSLARKPGVVILDARSAAKYEALHVKGAINLSFPDITVDSLNALLPDKGATVLIYCNNNFRDAPDPMPAKLMAAALNLATYTSLYTYGYRNVYELGPNLSVKRTRIPFEGTWVGSVRLPLK